MMGTELVTIPSDSGLAAIQQAKYEKALTCLVTGKTPPSDFKDGKIPTRRVRGGGEFPYIPGWWFQAQLNALFGDMWSFTVMERNIDLVNNQVVVSGELTITTASERVVRRPGTGGAEIDRYAEDVHRKDRQGNDIPAVILHHRGDIIDLADDIKSAETEALSRAARWLGFGTDVYNLREA